MKIAPNTPVRAITCQGIQLNAPAPYNEGHVLTPNEAAVLNQTLAENLRNNFASVVKAAVEKSEKEKTTLDVGALQTQFDAYVSEYEFGVHRAGARVTDPIDREAKAIAEEVVKGALAQRGFKISGEGGIGKEKFNELVAQYAARDDIRKQAEKRVKELQKLATVDLGL